MKGRIVRWIPWIISLGAALYTGSALMAQVAIGEELGAAMAGVYANVSEARRLTGETADALAPLATTAVTLEGMNTALGATVIDIAAINGAMGRITERQAAILGRLGSLNGRTEGLVGALGEIDSRNRALLSATAALAAQTEGQVSSLRTLSTLTEETIDHLAVVNRRFAFLRDF
jgi:hypothetical protein